MRLDALVSPRSIAILGASDRPSIGRILTDSLVKLGFSGGVYPVNPKYQTVGGYRCYPDLAALPERPDVLAVAMGPASLPKAMEDAAALGIPAAVVYAGGFAEQGEEGRALQQSAAAIARKAGIAVCGPNCMGVLNPHERSTTFMQVVRDPTGLAGNVGLVSHSGSICIGLLGDVRRFGFSAVISAGNEAVLTVGDYIRHLAGDERTRVIAVFMETVRDPAAFLEALDHAAAAGKPVVLIKVGRSERAGRAVVSHTGGMAGAAEVFSAAVAAHGALEVTGMDELTETVAALQGTRRPRRRSIGLITGSGGQAELILDTAADAGIDMPALPAAERAAAEAVIGPLGGDGNPLDYWGSGDYRRNLGHAAAVLSGGGSFGAVVYCNDAFDDSPLGSRERSLEYVSLFADAAKDSPVPHYFLNTRPGVMNRSQIDFLRTHDIPVLSGVRQGLRAIDRIAALAAPRPAARSQHRPVATAMLPAARGRGQINEHDAKAILAAYGLPVTRERRVGSLEAAQDAARSIGFPVVLKAVSDALAHKSELGLVALDLRDPATLESAWDRLAARLAAARVEADFLVQEMVTSEIEVFAGIVRDPDFGPAMAFGLGGIHVELFRDFQMRLLPLRAGDAEAMIQGIRGAGLFGALRGRPPADVESLAACLYAFSDFAMAEAADLAEVDLNPIKLLPQGAGCRIVDALIKLEALQ